MHEFDCERCGIHVYVVCGPVHPENVYCLSCRFIESIETIENADARQQAAAFIDRITRPPQDQPGAEGK